ncbi:MAG: SMP-30/gluconolactonase/LRE family protein [Planctomycetota bacterium]
MSQIGVSRMGLLLFGIVGCLSLRGQAAGIDELFEADSLERIATGFNFTEGPAWHPDGYLLFSDVRANTIYKWTPDGAAEPFRSPSGYANGLTFDGQGRLIACEHRNRRISRTEPDGTTVTLAGEYDGKRLNSPNDAVVKSDGSIYFTDPPWGLMAGMGGPASQELPFQGLYRWSPEEGTLELLASDLGRPNGLAFTPDETILYVAETTSGTVYAFNVQPDGLLANRRSFVQVSGPDGMKVDMRGNLYVASGSGIAVYNSEGTYLGSIATPESTRNCAFGGDDHRTLFITAGTSVYRVQMKLQTFPDFNGDGIVDSADMCTLVDHWHTDNALYDIAPLPFGDDFVDVLDLIYLSEHLFQEVDDPTLIAHWALDETEGDTAHDSVNGNDDIIVGSALWQPMSGRVSGALELDGVDDCVITGFAIDPKEGPFSVFAWVRGGTPGQVIISQAAGANWLMVDTGGELMTQLRFIGGRAVQPPLVSQTVITDGQWHRVGFVWDGLYRALYVDDGLVAEDSQPGLADSSGGLNIGCGSDSAAGTFWSGLIDDVRIYNRAVRP